MKPKKRSVTPVAKKIMINVAKTRAVLAVINEMSFSKFFHTFITGELAHKTDTEEALALQIFYEVYSPFSSLNGRE